MQSNKYTLFILVALLLMGCGTKKKVVTTTPAPIEEPAVPAWHTCLIQNARAVVSTEDEKISANVTMQTVRDSMLVISVMPMLGMEMVRVEATPFEVIAIDKLHGRYARATYTELNRKLTPGINWDVLQQLCSAELPTGPEKARLVYRFGDETLELVITYPERKTDVPVRVTNVRLDKYTQIDISKWL